MKISNWQATRGLLFFCRELCWMLILHKYTNTLKSNLSVISLHCFSTMCRYCYCIIFVILPFHKKHLIFDLLAAVIGPPSAVNVTPVNGLLQIVITDPLSITNGSMKEWLPNMYYFIQYWKKSSSQVCSCANTHTPHAHRIHICSSLFYV